MAETPDSGFEVNRQHLPDVASTAHSCHYLKNSKFQNQMNINFAGQDSAHGSSFHSTNFSKFHICAY